MSTDTTVNSLIINKMTKAQYDSLTNPSSTELYLVPDEMDTTPTSGSTNPVTSNGIYTALNTLSGDIPTKTSDLTNDGSDGTSYYVEANELAAVATTNSYNDLDDKPTIPSIAGLAQDSAVVHITGNEQIRGAKTFIDTAAFDTSISINNNQNQRVYIDSEFDQINSEPMLNLWGDNDEKVRLGNIEEPRNDTDAATKYYVDHHGGGGGGGAGTLNTTNTSALTPSASESLGGTVNLHKVSKTGTYSDLIGTPTYALGESVGGPASLTVSLPYGFIDSTSTATVMTATVSGITELRDGVTCIIVNKVVGSASGVTLNVNGLGPKPIYCFYDDSAEATTFFSEDKTCMFVYDSTLVDGGCWKLFYPFPSDTSTTANNLRTYYTSLPSATACGRYRILFTSADGTKYVPANTSTSTSATTAKTPTTEKIDPFGKIVFYNYTTTRTAGQTFSTAHQYLQYQFALGYSFNTTGAALTLTENTPVYIVCNPQTDGSAIIDAITPYTQSLPTTADGKIYIYLGIAISATNVEIIPSHPVYQYKDGKIICYTGSYLSNKDLVHTTGNEYIGGIKTFNDDVIARNSLLLWPESNSIIPIWMTSDQYVTVGGVNYAVLQLGDSLNDNPVLLRGVHSPIVASDAVNKSYLDNIVGDIETLLAAI